MAVRSAQRWTAGVAAAALAVVGSACSAGGGGGGDVTLTVSSFLTEDHPASVAFAEWMDEVTEQTDGAVEFETFYNGSLCGAPDQVNCVENGTADIAIAVPAYTPEMTLSNVGSVAFVSNDLQANSNAINRLHDEVDEFQQEFEGRGMRLLYTFNNSIPVLATRTPIDGLDDLAGLDIRASGATTTALDVLDANPVAIDPGEIYEAVERGVVQGVTLPLESIVDYRLHEVAPHIYDIGEFMGSYATNNYLINAGAFDRLSADQQDVVTEVSEQIAGRYVEDFLNPLTRESCETIADGGGDLQEIGPEAAGLDWREQGLALQREAWEAQATSVVDDPSALFERYLELVDEETDPAAPLTTLDVCAEG